MIQGEMNENDEPIIPLTLRSRQGLELAIDAVVDTGFNGALTLPTQLIEELGYPWYSHGRAGLADGQVVDFDIHSGLL